MTATNKKRFAYVVHHGFLDGHLSVGCSRCFLHRKSKNKTANLAVLFLIA